MGKAIVTGATGFVGSNLCRLLIKEGWDVCAITRKSSSLDNIEDLLNSIEVYEYSGNVDELTAYFVDANADVVFHLASVFISEHKASDVEKLLLSNINFGVQIMEAMNKSSTKLMVNTGTSWQHYHSNEYNPVNLYASTKEAFESIGKFYIEARELRIVTLKLFDTYGETDKRKKLMNILSSLTDDTEVLKMSEGNQFLDLVHVDDVCRAYIRAYDYMSKNRAINTAEYGVGSQVTYSLREIVDIFERLSNRKLHIEWGGRPYRSREVMRLWENYELVPNWIPEISIEEGIRRLIDESFVNHK